MNQPDNTLATKAILDQLTNRFFSLFTNKGGAKPDLARVYNLFLPNGIIIKNVDGHTEVYTLHQFIEPREKLLTGGTLTEFSEEEVSEHTAIYRNIAQRFCKYKKSGILSGTPFEGNGMKTIQFVNTKEGWKMSSVAWDDEPDFR